jgi:hypothetical protein
MSEFLSMLVPLQTLAGWPTAKDPTPLQSLGLLFGIPLAVMIVVSVLIKARSLMAASRGSNAKYTQPTWVGAKEGVHEILGDDNAAGQAALQAGPSVTSRAHGDQAADDTGGASARW